MPYVGFSLIDADENAVSGDISITPDTLDLYSYTFVGNDGNDRFALSLDDDKLKYLCVLRDDGTGYLRIGAALRNEAREPVRIDNSLDRFRVTIPGPVATGRSGVNARCGTRPAPGCGAGR